MEEKINEFDYRIKIGNKSKIYHINLLKEYVEREGLRNGVTAAIKDVDVEEENGEEVIAVVIKEDETSDTVGDSDPVADS